MKKYYQSLLCAFFCCLPLFQQSQTLHAQMRDITLDGAISYFERIDTLGSKPEFVSHNDIMIRKDSSYYYFGIHNNQIGSVNLIFLKADTCVVMHISGSVTRLFYRQIGTDSLMITKYMKWVTRNPESWEIKGGKLYYDRILKTPRSDAEIQADLQHILQQLGYAATTGDMGSALDCEVLLSRKHFRGYKLVIQYRKQPLLNGVLQTSMALYPPQPVLNRYIEPFTRFLEAQEGTVLRLPLSRMEWITLE